MSVGVARAAQVDPDRRVAVAGEVRVDPRVADGRRVVLAVRHVLEDRRHGILLGVLGQPDPRRETDAVRHRDPDVVEPPDVAREVAPELHTPAGMTVSVVDTIGGVTFDDPYRWLEEDSPETRSWQQRQDAAARETIGALPALEPLREAAARRRHESLVFVPSQHGQRWFRLVAGGPGSGPVLAVGSRIGDGGRTIVDPSAFPGTEVSLDWFSPAPDGAHVAFGLSQRGDEQSVLHVLEVESGRLLPDRIAHASFGVVAWLPDSSGFFYNAGLGPDTERPQKHIFLHRLGDDRPALPESAPVREDEEFVFPQVSPDGRWVMAVSSEVEPRPDAIRAVEGGEWRPFLLGLPGTFAGFVHGDRYLAVTTDGAPRGRLVSIPLESPRERSTWHELVPQGDGVLRSACLAADRLALVDLVDTRARGSGCTPSTGGSRTRYPYRATARWGRASPATRR